MKNVKPPVTRRCEGVAGAAAGRRALKPGQWQVFGTGAGRALAVAAAAALLVLSCGGASATPTPAARPTAPRAVALGERAPGFALADHAGRSYSLADYAGPKVLLVYYMGYF
ncbi:MAG: hypothetical protein EXR60_05935 [Dehalococcoidia bacterium]|nr:hypothetical protein [Dehalococcoidia bacterium]